MLHKDVKQSEEKKLRYHLARADFHEKLLDMNLKEELTIINAGDAILPNVRVTELTPEQADEWREKIAQEKKLIMENLGIKL